MEGKLIKTEVNYLLKNEEGVIIASTSLINLGLALSVKNCQEIERGYDLDELIDKYCRGNSKIEDDFIKKGFQKALEILGDKKFTYNQMVSAITESSISHRLPSLIIQDLQQTEWDCIIEMDTDCTGEFKYFLLDKGKPKLDSDNCIILKRKI